VWLFPLTIKGSSTVALQNVAVGEVWVAGGQSNMWWHVSNSKNPAEEAKNGNYPTIRVWDATINSPVQGGFRAQTPQRTVNAAWKTATPQSVPDFPGVPYFFARDLQKKLGVPVGIVHVAVPGTDIELHMNPATARSILPQDIELEALKSSSTPSARRPSMRRTRRGKPPLPPRKRLETRARGAQSASRPPERELLRDAFQRYGRARRAIHRPRLFVVAGRKQRGPRRAVSNAVPGAHRRLAPRVEQRRHAISVRRAGQLRLPSGRAGQRRFVACPARRPAFRPGFALVYRVSAIDILDEEGPVWNIHPLNKQMAGNRLFLAAMANVYGDKTASWSGPTFTSATFKNSTATVNFAHAAGLKAREGTELKGFALAGSDRKWHWAQAKIVGATVVLSSPNVPQPVAVRYGWHINPLGNLVNSASLPTFPFRSDNWNLQQ
jgi:sialate O-acetylesterase